MPKKILIVDDNKTVRTLLSINLRKENFEVIEAENGAEGLQMVNDHLPDLVISDIIMPQMDGFEFCRKVRETSKSPMVPFMFLTSIDQVATELRGLRTGADDYLIKSNIKKEELVGKVSAMLQKSNEYKQAENQMQEGL
ncbi:MAG TPA: response regulator, partial [bacterium]|nr:response regulator [bacterium]